LIGGTLMLMQKPAGQQAEHTAMSFEVNDIVAQIRSLRARRAVFEDYDLPGLRTVEHVCVLGIQTRRLVQGPGRQHPLPARGRRRVAAPAPAGVPLT